MAKAKINPEFTYKTRDGHTVIDLHANPNDDIYQFTATIDGRNLTYTNRGYYFNDGSISRYDLIKQLVKRTKPVVKEIEKEVMKNASTPEVIQQDGTSTQHVHHDMIVVWAKNPKLEVQVQAPGATEKIVWRDTKEPAWYNDLTYRFKPEEPKFLTIIGADGKARSYPEPCKKEPEIDIKYFVACISHGTRFWLDFHWNNDDVDEKYFHNGLIHLTKEAAELHAKAMLGID